MSYAVAKYARCVGTRNQHEPSIFREGAKIGKQEGGGGGEGGGSNPRIYMTCQQSEKTPGVVLVAAEVVKLISPASWISNRGNFDERAANQIH